MLSTRTCLVIAAITVAVGSSSAAAGGSEDQEAVFQKLAWTTVRSVQDIQPSVLAALQSRFGADPRLANPGEPFEATDVVSGRPARRLLLAGHADTWWFVAYERGGRGHHLVLAVFDCRAASPMPTLLARGKAGKHDDKAGWRADLADLRGALKSGALSRDDPNAAYY